MSIFLTLVTIAQSFSISLGVGSSTLAITNFFAAIADGVIDDTERRMMGIVYVVLRVAMVAILFTTILIIITTEYSEAGLSGLSSTSWSQLIVLAVLYINALLMTAHLVPSTVGPGVQAGSWYTLGTLSALQIVGITNYALTTFLLAYVTWIVLAVGIVNGVMAIMNHKRAQDDSKTEAE